MSVLNAFFKYFKWNFFTKTIFNILKIEILDFFNDQFLT